MSRKPVRCTAQCLRKCYSCTGSRWRGNPVPRRTNAADRSTGKSIRVGRITKKGLSCIRKCESGESVQLHLRMQCDMIGREEHTQCAVYSPVPGFCSIFLKTGDMHKYLRRGTLADNSKHSLLVFRQGMWLADKSAYTGTIPHDTISGVADLQISAITFPYHVFFQAGSGWVSSY